MSKRTKPAPASPASVSTPPAPRPVRERSSHVVFRNRMAQALSLIVLDAAGVQQQVTIPSQGMVRWPRLDDYGPDVVRKRSAGHLGMEAPSPS